MVDVRVADADECAQVRGAEGEHRHPGRGRAALGLREELAPLERDAAAHVDEVLDRHHDRAHDLELGGVAQASERRAVEAKGVAALRGERLPVEARARRRRDVVEQIEILDLEREALRQASDAHARHVRGHADPAQRAVAHHAEVEARVGDEEADGARGFEISLEGGRALRRSAGVARGAEHAADADEQEHIAQVQEQDRGERQVDALAVVHRHAAYFAQVESRRGDDEPGDVQVQAPAHRELGAAGDLRDQRRGHLAHAGPVEARAARVIRRVVAQVERQDLQLEAGGQPVHAHQADVRGEAHPAAQCAARLGGDGDVEARAADAESGGRAGVEAGDVAVAIGYERAVHADEELQAREVDGLQRHAGSADAGAVVDRLARELLVLEGARGEHEALQVDLQRAADREAASCQAERAAADHDRVGVERSVASLEIDCVRPVERGQRTVRAGGAIRRELEPRRFYDDARG